MRLEINKPDFPSGLEGQGWAGVRLTAAQGDGEERQGGEARRRKAGEDREGSLTARQMCRGTSWRSWKGWLRVYIETRAEVHVRGLRIQRNSGE